MRNRQISKSQGRRVRLSANPLELQDPDELFEEPEAPVDEFGDGGEEEPFEDEQLESSMYRGKRVSGPRTKLASMEQAIVSLADNQAMIARSLAGIAKAVISREDEEDDDDKEDKELRKGRTSKAVAQKARTSKQASDFAPYGETTDEGDPESADPEETTMNEPGLQDPKGATELTNARKSLRKDDAASSFGEKDDTVPGNREAGIDEKDKPAEEYLIQGEAGDGPGPVSKALKADLDKAYTQVLARHGIVRKAVGPRPGNSSVETGPAQSMDDLCDAARRLSFRELNQMREKSGNLSSGIF